MKRRMFLKIFGGVAAAPAVVAPSAVLPIAPLAALPLSSIVGDTADNLAPDTDTYPPVGKFDKFKRLSRLRRLLLGREQEEEESWTISRRRRQIAETRMNSLRSMSPSAKILALSREVRQIEKEANRIGWFQEYRKLRKGDDD